MIALLRMLQRLQLELHADLRLVRDLGRDARSNLTGWRS